ncbi:MAG: PIN domain-containing protein [Euryarchaeota archaeon]|nr:PIN domain-containing protein [Euryarchaeota archaeon]
MILDTSFVIDILRGDFAALGLLDELESGTDVLRIPTPAYFELVEGVERSRYPPREWENLRDTLDRFPSIGLESRHALRAGRISGALIRRGRRIDPVDILIAGIALEEGEAVVTRDVDDFGRVEGLGVRTY